MISNFFKWIWKNVLFESANEIQFECGTYTVRIVNTWLDVWTAWRLIRVSKYLNEEFYLTYWDAISDVNLNSLEKHYRKNKESLVILTAVNPISNFWLLEIKKSLVTNFSEKKKDINSWINGGFFFVNKKCLNYICNDAEMWEEILDKLSKEKKLRAYKHYDFWFCIDTKKDILNLEKLLNN
jgi:glucose-1-phosphate cytidylyltransferase